MNVVGVVNTVVNAHHSGINKGWLRWVTRWVTDYEKSVKFVVCR